MKYTLKAYNIWELGARDNQEDSLFPAFGTLSENDRLFIVCDGMGGHSDGEVASKTVCETMSDYIMKNVADQEGEFTDDDFKDALNAAYLGLDAKDNGAEKKMGTTLTFLKLHSQGATIAHIGDSRVYHIRPGKDNNDTQILFQTLDHSLVNDLVKIGEMTPEEAKTSRQKNIITRAMQPNGEHRHRADIYHTVDIKPGDYFMLCSDGILEQMEDDNIKFIFSEKAGDDENKVDMIINLTENNRDNHTAIIVRITDVIDPLPIPEPEHKEEQYLPVVTEETEDLAGNDDEPISDPVIEDEKKVGLLGNILNNIFKNHVISSIVIVALLVIVSLIIIFRNSNKNMLLEAIESDYNKYIELLDSGKNAYNSGNYREAVLNYDKALDIEKKYSTSEYAGKFGGEAEKKLELAKQAHEKINNQKEAENRKLQEENAALKAAEQARLEKEKKEREAAEKARLEKEQKEREAAEKARLEKEQKEREAAEKAEAERLIQQVKSGTETSEQNNATQQIMNQVLLPASTAIDTLENEPVNKNDSTTVSPEN